MVGAIADWFAVTALFRHPLGLPIPHTALIPRRKDELGRSLEEFVGENFLHESVVRERIDAAGLSRRFGSWLERPRTTPAGSPTRPPRCCTWRWQRIRDEDMVSLVEEALLPRFIAEPISPIAGSLLEEVVRDGAHHGLVDLVLDEAHRWLTLNEETFVEILGERAPWWSPAALNERVTHRLHLEAVDWVEDIRRDPYHHARGALDSALAQLADDLLHDPPTQERMERLKGRVLSHPQLVVTATSLWNAFRRALMESLDDPEGPLRAPRPRRADRLRRAAPGRRPAPGPARPPGRGPRRLRRHRYGAELTAVITHTVEPLGRQGGRPQDRAARRPRPAVHPDQRHHRRRPGRRADPRRQRAALSPGRRPGPSSGSRHLLEGEQVAAAPAARSP